MLEPVFSHPEKSEEKITDEKQVSEKVPEAAPRKKLRRMSRENQGPSIKDALSGKMKDEKISAKEQHQIFSRTGELEEFSQEQLKMKWESFLERLVDRPNLQSTLSKVPHLDNDFQLRLEIDNSVQEDLINTIRPELVSWLRKELKNSKIQLITKINQSEKESIIYTDSEKYSEMLKKNPKLEMLKKRFNLDFG